MLVDTVVRKGMSECQENILFASSGPLAPPPFTPPSSVALTELLSNLMVIKIDIRIRYITNILQCLLTVSAFTTHPNTKISNTFHNKLHILHSMQNEF